MLAVPLGDQEAFIEVVGSFVCRPCFKVGVTSILHESPLEVEHSYDQPPVNQPVRYSCSRCEFEVAVVHVPFLAFRPA